MTDKSFHSFIVHNFNQIVKNLKEVVHNTWTKPIGHVVENRNYRMVVVMCNTRKQHVYVILCLWVLENNAIECTPEVCVDIHFPTRQISHVHRFSISIFTHVGPDLGKCIVQGLVVSRTH